MNIQFAIAIGAAIIYLLTAVFVYFQNRQGLVNRSFALMLLCVSVWQINVAGIRGAPSAEFADMWGHIFRSGLLFIPPVFLHFAWVFTNPQKPFSSQAKKILIISCAISCFLVALNMVDYFFDTDYLTGEARRYHWGGYGVKGGPFFPIFIVQFFACIIVAFLYLIRGFYWADHYQKHRIQYFFLAMGIGFVVGGVNFLPMFDSDVYPFGNIGIVASLMVMTYIIVQHRLMDVSVFMAKGLGTILSLILLAVPGAIILALLEMTIFNRIDLLFTALVVIFGCLCALFFTLINAKLGRAMHQIIVRDKYDYHRILEEFSRRLVTIVDMGRLLHALAETVEQSMKVTGISIFLFNSEKEIYRSALARSQAKEYAEEISFKVTEPFIQILQDQNGAILRAEMDGNMNGNQTKGELLKMMVKFKTEVCLPLLYMHRLIGFINLGPKWGGGMYYREDLDLLNSLANQVAIAIENANLYENLKKSQGIMRRSDRLASLGTLIASLAHEIRNPLVSIKTFTQLLPERMEDEEFRDYFLKVASGEIDRLTSLINELLGFARPSEPNLQGEDVNGLIEKMGFLVATEARKKNIVIHKTLSSSLPLVMIDPEQVKQVLLNVLLNAVQAIQGGGQIWVETRVVQVQREDSTESYVQIEIRDTGAGITKENLDRVFDPFFSTRPDGSGLGLAISHQIIHEHGGFIDLESEVGKGTSFRIHLPLKRGGTGAA